MNTEIRSIGDKLAVRRAAANTAVTAGGSGDDALVTGAIIDRAAIGWPQSCVAAIPFTATLDEDETLSVGHVLQTGDADNLSDARTHDSAGAAILATGGAGGSTESGCAEVNINLAGAGRYVRLNFTPAMSRAATDTAALSAVLVFGGMERLPQ